jgi:predicted nuclease of predicted toxin-antitoxin system
MPSKKIRLKLYADENFPVGSVTYLKSLGISIIHAYDLNHITKSDLFHLKVSKSLGRILITRDRDFNYNWTSLKEHPGVILISPGNQTSDAVNQVCNKAFKKLTSNFIAEALVRVTIDKITRNKNEKIDEIEL